MAGHSKWANIRVRKGAQDKKRGKIFQKLVHAIYKAAKAGGPDPDMNPPLRLAIEKARGENMPNDNIERAIKRATDPAESANFHEVIYEGYGPDGVAIYVEALTDNVNRTATNVRTAIHKNGGSLGEKGSVAYMFDRKGYIAILRDGLDVDEDTMLMSVLDAGGEDLHTSEEAFEIYTETSDFAAVRDALDQEYKLEEADLVMIPKTKVQVEESTKEKLLNMFDALEDDDDVTEVYHNAILDEEDE
ncbi:YebC/PmpR family DNA-binding transcriptional regulator [Allofustis seminis]|uniref:YebC/PmpR family DNA-binding transcriptional regulator n=1 Tax=Allofustis seminis TaxID=166939 RepID=UPI0004766323|nr:YebC/PmpR family DNA-binding transcriptional regulator [Allofustis seminis]